MGIYKTQFEITKAIFDTPLTLLGVNGKTKTVLLYISSGFFKDEVTGEFQSKVAQTHIAVQSGIGRNTVNQCVKTLEALGIITSKARLNTSKVYTWVALPTDTAKTARAKENRKVSKELRKKLSDVSKLTQWELLNVDRQIKSVELCKGSRLFTLEDFSPFKLKDNFSYEIKGINNKAAQSVKDLLRQGYNIDTEYEVQRLEDIEKCSGYVLYKNSMTPRGKTVIPAESIAEAIDSLPETLPEEPPDFEQAPLACYNYKDFGEQDNEYQPCQQPLDFYV